MPREELYLQDIIEAANSIESFLQNIEKSQFSSSDLLQSAVFHKFTIIGEAAAKISSELKNRYPQIQWKEIIGLRNIVVHAYFSVDRDIIWETAATRTTVLRQEIREILEHEFPDFQIR